MVGIVAMLSSAFIAGCALQASEAGSAELGALSALERAYPVNAGSASSIAGQPDGSFAPIHHFHSPTPEELAAQVLPLPNILRDPGMSLDARFPARFSQPGRVSFAGVGVDVRPLGAREQSVGQIAAENTLVYKDAFENCDVAYRCSNDKVEEFLCVRAAGGGAAWSWDIDLRSAGISLHPRLNASGQIELLDASASARLRIDAPEGKDANGRVLRYGQRLKYALDDSGNGRVRLTLTADLHGLAFPVAIDPSWSATSSLGFPRASHTGTLLNNGKVLIAGGENGTSMKFCELFDPAGGGGAGSFTATGSLNTARQQHIAVLLQDGRVFVAGGLDSSNNPLKDGEVFDPAGNAGVGSWTAILATSMSAPRTLHAAALLTTNGNVLITGGTTAGSVPVNSVDLFDPVGGAFSAGSSMGVPRQFHTATTLASGKVLVTGGEDAAGNPIQSAEVFDPVALSWSPTASAMSTARYSHKAVLLPNPTHQVLIAGGFNPGLFPSAEIYDPTSNSFNPTGSMSRVRTEHRIAVLSNGKVLLSGCHDGSFANVELYDPFTTPLGSFQITGSMVRPHTKHTLTTMADGRILVTGGKTGFVLDTAEIYDPHSEPVAQPVTANGPTPLAITLQTNSIDDQAPSFAAASQPSNGSLSGTGSSRVYTANAGYSGSDSFTFTSTDIFGISAPATISITVNSLVPVVSATIPNASIAGSPGFTMIVNGSGFVKGSVVQFNSSGRPTTFVSTTQLSAVIPASDAAVAGNATVTVFNPTPGGGTSAPQTFNTMSGALGVWIVTNRLDSGTGSLRFCMSNVRSGDTIIFDPTVFALVNSSAATVINVLSQLPTMDKGNVTIDASNCRVTVNGSAAGSAFGLLIASNINKVMGLSIVGFTNDGIAISGGTSNQIGGSRALPGTGAGPNGQGLRISGNGAFGIEINAAGSANIIKGCWIGLDASGAAPEPNLAGILMQAGASNNVIGSIVTDEANFISGNLFEGITVSDVGTNNNVVMGNVVGASAITVASASLGRDASDFTSLSGRSAVANGSAGVFLSKGTNSTQVGGDTAGQGNGIGNNGGNGIEVRAALSRKNSSKGNKISKNKHGGITLFDGSNDGIQPPHLDIVSQSVATRAVSTVTTGVHIAGHASSDGTVEIFTDPDTQGGTLWGRTPCVNGQFQTDVQVNPSENITATLTDTNGNTSPFSVFGPAPTVGAPVITSSLTSLAMIGTPFSLQLTASGTQPVTFGASQLPAGLTLSGDTITGTPTAGGTFMIHITATNSAGTDSKTLILIVNTSFTLDSDGDGVPDWLEVLAGTDPNNPLSFPATQDPLSVDKISFKLGAGTAPDSLSAQMRVTLPAGLVATGTMVSVQVGNVIRPGFMLDGKGHASKGTTSVMVRPATKGSSTMVIVFTIKNDKLKTDLALDGFTDVSTGFKGSKLSLPVGVAVTSKGTPYVSSNTVNILYKAKKGKGGNGARTQ